MIVATRLSAVWQVAGVAAAALCCYLVSQSVATERAGLEKVDHQIADTRDDIAKLETEIGVRARMGQLESWNRNVLALQAPRPSQFVASGFQLAALYGRHGQPTLQLDPAIASQQGSPMNAGYHTVSVASAPPAPVAVAPTPQVDPGQPVLRTAAYIRPAPDRLAGAAGPASASPVLQKASYEAIRAPAVSKSLPMESESEPAGPKPVAARFARTVEPKGDRKVDAKPATTKLAARDSGAMSLLPTDIGQLAAREAKGARNGSKAAR